MVLIKLMATVLGWVERKCVGYLMIGDFTLRLMMFSFSVWEEILIDKNIVGCYVALRFVTFFERIKILVL